jgi:hypothetical protein
MGERLSLLFSLGCSPQRSLFSSLVQLYAFLSQLRRHSRTAPLSLLSLYIVFLLDTSFALVQQARSVHIDTILSLLFLSRLPDLLLMMYLVAEVLQMPLNRPLLIAAEATDEDGKVQLFPSSLSLESPC